MILLKHFNVATQALIGAGSTRVLQGHQVSDLIPILNERMKWPSRTPLKLYEVIYLFHDRL